MLAPIGKCLNVWFPLSRSMWLTRVIYLEWRKVSRSTKTLSWENEPLEDLLNNIKKTRLQCHFCEKLSFWAPPGESKLVFNEKALFTATQSLFDVAYNQSPSTEIIRWSKTKLLNILTLSVTSLPLVKSLQMELSIYLTY